MYLQMVQIEQKKLMRRRMFWMELGLLILAVLGMFGIMYYAKYALETGIANSGNGVVIEGGDAAEFQNYMMWPDGLLNTFLVVRSLGGFLAIILAGAVMAQEYTWRSLSLWLSRGVPRSHFLTAKFTAVAITILLMTGTAVLVGALVSGAFSTIYLDTLPFSHINWGMAALNVITTSLTLAPFAALALLLALASRSALVAVGGGLAYITLVEPLARRLLPMLGEKWGRAATYLPGSLADTIGQLTWQVNANAGSFNVPAGSMSVETAVFATLLTVLCLMGIALLIFRRQDLGG